MAGIDTSKIKAKSGGDLTITDDNDNETLVLKETASAVNEIAIANAATGNGPSISSQGGDTNVDLHLNTKGTGAVNIRSSYLRVDNGSTGPGELRIYEDSDNGSHYFALKATAAMGDNLTYVLPAADGSNGQQLTTDGSGNLSWTNQGASGGGSTAADDISTGDAAVTIATSAGNITIDAQANDSDIILKGTDGGSDTTFLTIDGSDAGTATFNNDVKLGSDSAILSLGAGDDATLTHDGTTGLTIAATPISIDSTGELHLNSTTGDIKLQDGGTDQIAFDLDGTAGAVIMKTMVDSDDLVIQQYDGNEVIRFTDDGHVEVKDNLSLKSDSSVLKFGTNEEITLTHSHDKGLTLTHTATGDNTPIILQLKSEEDAIIADEVIASIEFAAGDSDGTDAATVAAGIHAIAEGTFAENANATKLVFTTGVSETAAASATAKMTLSSAGTLTVADDVVLSSDDSELKFGAGNDVVFAHDNGTGMDVTSAGDFDISSGGNVTLTSTVNEANAIHLRANGGTSETIKIHADQGTGAGSIELTSDAGSIDINAGDNITIDADDDISLTTGTADGLITIHSAHTAGQAILIDANADAGSILDIDAGILDIDVQADAAITAGSVTITTDTATFSSTSTTDPAVQIVNATNDANGARLQLVKDKGAAGAANDVNGLIQFIGDDAAQDLVMFSEIKSQVKVHTNGEEGGKFTVSVASHNGTPTAGLVIEDGDASGELDVTIGAGTSSVTTIAGNLQIKDDKMIAFGDDGDAAIKYDEAGSDTLLIDGAHVRIDSGNKIQFRDAALTINSSADGQLDLEADTTIAFTTPDVLFTSTTSEKPVVTIQNLTNDAEGAKLKLVKNRGSNNGADDDVCGTIVFEGTDDASNQHDFAQIKVTVADASNGAEGGKIQFLCATHDAELQPGLIIQDGSAEDELDVTVGNGAASVVTIPGTMDIAGAVDIAGDLTLSAGADGALVFGNAGENSIKIPDGQASALIIEEANNSYITFQTTNSSERIIMTQAPRITDDVKLHFGSDEDGHIVFDASQSSSLIIGLPDAGLTLRPISTGDNKFARLNIMSNEAEIAANEIIGQIDFQAIGESSGTDANEICASIQAKANADFTASSNETSLQFYTAKSEDATSNEPRLIIEHNGTLTLNAGTTAAVGSGFNGNDGTGVKASVQEINNEVVTTIKIDIDGFRGSAGDGKVIGDNGAGSAYITQLAKGVNGLIYKAELLCVESVAGGPTQQIDVYAKSDNQGQGNSIGGTFVKLIESGGNVVAGIFKEATGGAFGGTGGTPADGLDGMYLYIATGTSGGSDSDYTAGKIVIRLYGVKEF